jgi:hypothetical protein
MSAFPAMMAGGAGLSTIGGILGASSSNRAGRQSRDFYNDRTQEGSLRYGTALWGDRYRKLFPDTAGGYLSPEDQAKAMDELAAANGGPVVPQLRQLADTVSARQTGNLRYYDDTTQRLDRESGRRRGDVMALARDAEGIARTSGLGSEQVIRDEAARTLREANGASDAAAVRSGFGGSTTRLALRNNNATRVGEGVARGLVDNRRATTASVLGARGQSLGLLSRFYDQDASRGIVRAAGRQDLEEGNLARDIRLRQDPINVTLAGQGSANVNPWLGQNTSQYYPGVSAAGTGLVNGGNALAMLGAYGKFNQSNETNPADGWY